MKDIILIIVTTLISAVLWLGINGMISKTNVDTQKVLDHPMPISGKIDLEFLRMLDEEPAYE